MGFISNLTRQLKDLFSSGNTKNFGFKTIMQQIGELVTFYKDKPATYLKEGYNINPIVYSVVNQMASKTASIPFYVKKVKDKKARTELKNMFEMTNQDMTHMQKVRYKTLEAKAYDEMIMDLPLEQPNPYQTWTAFKALYKTYLKLTGNVFISMESPEAGQRAGQPIAIYLLPSSCINIIVKKESILNFAEESELITGYLLTVGKHYRQYRPDEIIHIKYPNPNFEEDGSHLYGLSPLRAALRNIQSSNLGLDLNVKTLQNGGAFGFIHGKTMSITPDQATEIKERLLEMEKSPEKLSKIAGVSAEIGFTRISLTTDELKPFDYLNFDTKQICNVLVWSDKLLNNDTGAKYDNVSEYRKQVITDNIVPDLKMLSDALNKYFIKRFKGYENAELYFDVSELPEMQTDTKSLSDWLNNALDRGVITRNEYRVAVSYEPVVDNNMDSHTVQTDVLSLAEAMDNTFKTV